MVEAVGNEFWKTDVWAQFYNTDITDELMAGMKVHGTAQGRKEV